MEPAERFEVILIGAGIIGSAIAMALGERGVKTLAVDVDLSGRLSSSEKNAGGVRATWWQPVNIALCRASIKYYETIAAEVGFRQKGYLWLYDERTWERAREHLELQRSHGQPIEALTATEVNRRVPEIDKLDGIAGATFSPRDGLINPNLLKQHYRSRALRSGVRFLDRTFVLALDSGASGVRLECWQSDDPLTEAGLMRLMAQDEPGDAETGRLFALSAESIVITGGAWSERVVKMAGLKSLSVPIRRQICLVDNRATNLERYGMIVDTSGLYFHNEGAHILAGYSPPDTPPGYHFHYDGEPFFRDEIWPRLFARMSCMERLRHVTGWAGLYEVSPDRSAIIGRAAPRVFEAHSFSGRGVMQSYGAAQALAALIATGSYRALDASALGRERFARGAQVFEELHI
jgi:FAD-dependent oxidoreductase domain-containing protein 1